MVHRSSPPMRWVSIIGLLMLLLSSTPFGVAAQTGLNQVGDVAQSDTGAAIEAVITECPPNTPAGSLGISGCTTGIVGVGVNVTSVDPPLGVDLDKTSVATYADGTGPGVINTDVLPAGDYRVEIDLPADGYIFDFTCHQRGTDIEVPVYGAADGATNAFQVSNEGDVDVVCEVVASIAGNAPVMNITYRECSRGDLPGDGRTYEDLRDNCTVVSTDAPTLSVRDINLNTEPVSTHHFDATGDVSLALSPGDFQMFTDLSMDDWGEYLFCEFAGQPTYEKDFDPSRGIVTFSNLLPNEQFDCSWFAVNATSGPMADDNSPATDNAQILPQSTDDEGTAVLDVHLSACPVDYQGSAWYSDCHANGVPGMEFSLLGPDNLELTATTSIEEVNGPGVAHFTDLPAGDYTLMGGPPQDFGHVVLYCTDRVTEAALDVSFQNSVGTFTVADGQDVICDWYYIPEDMQGGDTNAAITISMLSCPIDDGSWDSASFASLQANCTTPTVGVVVNIENAVGSRIAKSTAADGTASFVDLLPSDWSMWSEIPLEAANEVLFCSTDGGELTAIPLSERGVATFAGVDGDQIDCLWYVVPENLRGDITGSSVEVHLSACPTDYKGSSWYADCHDNGIGDMEFTLTGPGVDESGKTVVERTPGPGIVRFTSLPAGEYVLAGGPPQDFGHVFLYCSDPSTNTQIDTEFKDFVGHFTLAENQSVICDWYFVPENGGGEPTPEVKRAEILTTMFLCPTNVNVAGASFSELDGACTTTVNDVPMTLQAPGGVPLTANTGASGDGAVKFFDLKPGTYVMTPKLPSNRVSAAVYCDLDGGSVYQKALSNGAVTFVDVDGEKIGCFWFLTAKPDVVGPTGSITVREMLCKGDRSSIVDWERECQPGASGVSFTIKSSNGAVNQTLTPNANGVAVFSGLPNEYYDVTQSQGVWCRAKAERVDAQSRVIVTGGGNTDLFVYQCNQQIGLPNTGSGPIATTNSIIGFAPLMLAVAAVPFFAAVALQIRRRQIAVQISEAVVIHEGSSHFDGRYRK